MEPNCFIILHLLYLVCLTVPSTALHRVSYNDSCNQESRCDSRASLTCNIDNKCACLMPETMFYDSTRLTCVSPAGEKCIYTTVEGDMSWTDEVSCISHAKCVKGICECNPDFFEHSNGTCIEKRQHGDPCSKDDMCHQTLHLVCGADGTCDCNNTRLYDDTRKTCLVKVANSCEYSNGNDCVENAHCVGFGNSRCWCNPKYFENTDGICERRRNYGELCVDNRHCKYSITVDLPYGEKGEIQSYLSCNNGTCGCDSYIAVKNENISDGIQTCGKSVGQYCSDQGDTCTAGSECTHNRVLGFYRVCTCISTHYDTEDKKCAAKRSYGETCKLDKECNQIPGLLICHPSENICTCENGTSRHPDFPESCAVSVNQTVKFRGFGEKIVPNAFCVGYNTYRFYCRCVNNTVASPNQKGYCFIREGDSCFGDMNSPITNRTCLAGLACQNGTCSCLYGNHQEYNEKEEKCITLIKGPCNESSECSHNSECIDDNGLKVCRCKRGFTGVNRKCDLAYGESCVQGLSYPKCDRLVPLQCSGNGKCDCLPLQLYDNNELKCRGLAGAECELNKDNFCIEGAKCEWVRSWDGKLGICRCLPAMKYQEDRTCGNRTSTEIQKLAKY